MTIPQVVKTRILRHNMLVFIKQYQNENGATPAIKTITAKQ